MNDMRTNETALNHRPGLTLVELLVVIVILGLVTAATIPLMQPGTAKRRTREAARMVSGVLANAQARAIATGRPVGVMFQRLSNQPATATFKAPHHSIEMLLCEVPPPWSGDSAFDVCAIRTVPSPTPGAQPEIRIRFAQSNNVMFRGHPKGTFDVGDQIRLNYRGRRYTIARLVPHQQDANLIHEVVVQPTPVNPGTPASYPFQIYRQPRRTADPPAQVPVGSVVDFEYAGFASGWLGALENPPAPAQAKLSFQQPVIVLFGPAGNLESVYWGMKGINAQSNDPGVLENHPAITSPWCFLIGEPEPTADTPVTQDKPKKNHLNYDNLWIAINPQSGLVTTSEVGSDFDEPDVGTYADVSTELDASRSFVKSAQNMTGR
jgi:prepilin-type N-terminal cleavage/methylation domain-containing protein